MKNFFRPEDFSVFFAGLTRKQREHLAENCNDKLNKLIESWPVVTGKNDGNWTGFVSEETLNGDTHKARLAFIEEIPTHPYSHEPDFETKSGVSAICKHCGTELTLTETWAPKV